MAAVKWAFVVLFGLGSAGALAMAMTADTHRAVTTRTAPPLALREFPAMPGLAAARPAPAAAPTEAAPPSEPVAAAPAEAPRAAEPAPEAAKPAEPAKAPEPEAAKPAEPAKAPEPVAAKPAPPAPAPAAPKPAAPAPAPVAAKPAPAPAAPAPEGLLNLRASDTADVYLDGKKLGGSPLLGVKAKAGAHKVRFDCYDAAGNTVAGTPQTVTVKADAEVDVEFPCPTE